MKQQITEEFYEFFKKLAANNHKEWFDENRSWYESAVKSPFEDLCSALIEAKANADKSFLELRPRDVIFRINRDIRFSKDKTPYKLNRSALIAPGGRKSMSPGGFYFELGPGGNAFYTGAYMPDKSELLNLRTYIAANQDAFRKIIENKEFKTIFGQVEGEKNKRLDAAFKTAGEIQPLMYNTQFYIKHDIPEKVVLSGDLTGYLLELDQKASAFTGFITRGISVAR